MQSVDRAPGLPLWSLLAAVPVVLALGFVTGMAIAAYRTEPAATVLETPVPDPSRNSGASNPLPSGDSSWMIPTGPGVGLATAPAITPITPIPVTVNPGPLSVFFQGTAANIDEARLALLTDFSLYRTGATTITFDYQPMRGSAGGPTLVGQISVQQYPAWDGALRADPDGLKRWLEAAARRVLPATTAQGFHIVWAVVDVVRDRPEGFSDDEVTPLDNRSYLIIRPLAATVDHKETNVALRSPNSPSGRAAAGSGSPWHVYGPVIRFDSTDLYLPLRAQGARPLPR